MVRTVLTGIFLSILTIFFLYTTSAATDKKGLKGWETNSVYNNLYNYKERDKIKGKVLKFKKVTPLPGMDPGTAFIFQEGDDEFLVHLCPWSFASPKETGIKKGMKTTLKGSWALVDDEDVFIAAKVTQGEHFVLKVRLTKDGTPFWTMTPEQLAAERKSQ